MAPEYGTERALTRDDVAAALRELAAGVATGSVRVDGDDGAVAVDVPDEVTFEAELEVADEVELEVELAWPGDAPPDDLVEAAGEPAADAPADDAPAADAPGDGPDESADGDPDVSAGPDPTDAGPDPTDAGTEPAPETAAANAELGLDKATHGDVASAEPTGRSSPVGPASGPGRRGRFEVYRDAADEWRWRLVHANGNVIADSGEGYARKRGAVNGLESVRANAPLAVVVEREGE